LNISYGDLERTETEINVRSGSIRQNNNDIGALQMGVEKLKLKIENLKKNATNVQAQDVEGKSAEKTTRHSRLDQSNVMGFHFMSEKFCDFCFRHFTIGKIQQTKFIMCYADIDEEMTKIFWYFAMVLCLCSFKINS
jgi:FtsZ-binding cell division protein ZapB